MAIYGSYSDIVWAHVGTDSCCMVYLEDLRGVVAVFLVAIGNDGLIGCQ